MPLAVFPSNGELFEFVSFYHQPAIGVAETKFKRAREQFN
jgi:hypothetical protein